MANVKLSALTAIADAAITATDIFPMTDADAGTPTTYKVQLQQLRSAIFAATGADWDTTDYLGMGAGTIPSSGMIRVGQGAIVADSPLIHSTATWNNAAVTFTHILVNITDTASVGSSLFVDLQLGGISKFKVDKGGTITVANGIVVNAGGLTVSAGTTAVQALTAVVGTFTVGDNSNVVTVVPTSGTYTGAGFRSAATRASSSAYYHFFATGDGSTISYIRGDGVAYFAGAITTDAGIIATTGTFSGAVTSQGGFQVTANVAAPAGGFAKNATDGLVLRGVAGSSYDAALTDPSNNYIWRVPTGTVNVVFLGGITATTGTFSGALTGSSATFSSSIVAGAGSALAWDARSEMLSPADGIILLQNAANTGFTRLQFGGTSSSFAAIRVGGTTTQLEFVLADNSAYALARALTFVATTSVEVGTANIATAGSVRLSNNTSIGWRNAANTSNHTLALNTSDNFTLSAPLTVTGSISSTTSLTATTAVTAGTAFIGPGTAASAGSIRLANNTDIAWRNAANSANVSFTVNTSNQFDFGANALLSQNGFQHGGVNASATGVVRLGNNASVGWRNAANSADILLTLNSSNIFTFGAALSVPNGITAGGVTSDAGATITGGTVTITLAAVPQLNVRYDASNRLEVRIQATGEAFLLPQGVNAGVILAGKCFVTGDGTWDQSNMSNGDLRIKGALWIQDSITAPTATTGYAAVYVDSADGDLKVKFADGVVKTLATDT